MILNNTSPTISLTSLFETQLTQESKKYFYSIEFMQSIHRDEVE